MIKLKTIESLRKRQEKNKGKKKESKPNLKKKNRLNDESGGLTSDTLRV